MKEKVLFNFSFSVFNNLITCISRDNPSIDVSYLWNETQSGQEVSKVRQPFGGFDRNQSVKVMIDTFSFSIASHFHNKLTHITIIHN